MSHESCQSLYEVEQNFWSLDVCTAASLGDIMHFVKYDIGNLKRALQISNPSGWTPLMFACARGHSSLVNYLLLSGAERNCKTKSGVTTLMLAITSGNLSTVEAIFHSSILEDRDYRKWTALFYAVQFTTEKCLSFLLQQGANVDVVDFQNETPLMMTIKIGRAAMVQLILQSATNLNIMSFKQESALTLADESHCPKIRSLIQERYQYLLKTHLENVELKNDTDVTAKSPKILKTSPFQKHQIGAHIKLGKSLQYSPCKAMKFDNETSKISSPWKISFPKKFLSPQNKPHNEVQNFLENLGLKKYWPLFRDEEVDFETLLTLNDENLLELGIKLLGPRRKIVLAIQQLRRQY